jgi:adenylate kinase family enzyme
MKLFEENEYFQKNDLLVTVSGEGNIESIVENIIKLLEK